jgi:hypothetical protein
MIEPINKIMTPAGTSTPINILAVSLNILAVSLNGQFSVPLQQSYTLLSLFSLPHRYSPVIYVEQFLIESSIVEGQESEILH